MEAGAGPPQSEDPYQTLFLAHPDGIVLIVAGRIALVNDRFAELSGYSIEEAIGMAPSDLVVPEERQRSNERVQALLENGAAHPSAYTLLRKDGAHVPVGVHSKPVRHEGQPAIISVVRDISEQRRAEESLRESEARFSTAFHDNPVPVLITRMLDGKLIDLNDAFLSMTGFRRAETTGRTNVELGMLVDPGVREAATASVRDHGTVRDFPAQIRRKTGEILDVLATMTQIELAGEPCFLATIVDITERKRLEEELQKMRDDLESKVERQLDRGNAYKLTFREFTVLHLIADGKADKEIAAELGISIYTVHRHVSTILGKMDSPSRTEAGTRALREGLLE